MTDEKPLTPRLSESRCLAGIQCERRLWLGWHAPLAITEAPKGSVLSVGHDVGRLAQDLFAGGVLVEEGPREFRAATTTTRAPRSRSAMPSLFWVMAQSAGALSRVVTSSARHAFELSAIGLVAATPWHRAR